MIVYSEKYLEHNREYHPENNQRLKTTMNLLTKKDVFEKVPLIEPEYAKREDILRIHTQEHFEMVRDISKKGGEIVGPETYLTEKSFGIAMLSAGGVITCIDRCFEGYPHSFALIRPPGHHAESNAAMGFCIFNNIAVGARYAIEKYNLGKVFILDFDVHHGNGTQKIFYSDPRVLYLSLHQYPLYPGTGDINETGEGEGEGFTINVPLPPKTCDFSYLKVFDEIVIPVLRRYQPDLILVSAGYDAHYMDPLGGMTLSPRCYYELAKRLKQSAESGIIFALEGGYNLDALADSVYATLAALFDFEEEEWGKPMEEDKRVTDYIDSRINAVKRISSRHWDLR